MFRDRILAKSAAGKKLIDVYYANSKELSKIIEQDAKLKKLLEIMINGLLPVINMYLEMDSALNAE